MNAAGKVASSRSDFEVISLVSLAHAASHFFQMVLPPLFPWLMKEFSLSFTSVGLLMTVFFVVSGLGQAVAGFAVDRFGAHRVLLAGLALLGLSGVLLAVSQNPVMLVLAAAVAGLGNAVFHPADFTLLNRHVSSPRLGHAFSTHGLTGTLGWAAAPVLMFAVASASTWRVAAVVAAVVVLVPFLLLLYRGNFAPPEKHEEISVRPGGPARDNAFGFLQSRDVWMCFAFFVFWTLAFSAVQNFLPPVLGTMYGLSLSLATSAVTAYMLGSAAGTVSGGFLVNGPSPDRMVAWGLAAAALIALVLATSAPPAVLVVPLMAAMGFCAGLAGPSRDMLVRKSAVSGAGATSYGRIYGFVYSGLDSGLAISPLLFGRLMDAGQLSQVIVGVALFQGLAILTALRVGQRVPIPATQS
ncbi:MFS transporter [Aromatoleum anaerobium]|uniref:MFS transporter n=1 Tax=Aromatoleum anaerobium TaxID=182180 RepID=A0N0U8_9RHOO|nr:MFS transporter [Aromatoleum anaerobium]ABK58626.1 putative major facilitator superfamily 1 protein [Aromatoleum anaerobium]MCK0505368.1 MFS transporter [Aromatoleum anaerobium]